jgi:hypothetical protein
MKSIGAMTITEAMPLLESVAKMYSLKLNRAKDFRLARRILAVRHSND